MVTFEALEAADEFESAGVHGVLPGGL
jgi:hypothetical protein